MLNHVPRTRAPSPQTMRVIRALASSALGVTLSFAIEGAVFAHIGAVLSVHAAEARSHLRRLI